jgi:hypothetical protein
MFWQGGWQGFNLGDRQSSHTSDRVNGRAFAQQILCNGQTSLKFQVEIGLDGRVIGDRSIRTGMKFGALGAKSVRNGLGEFAIAFSPVHRLGKGRPDLAVHF